MNNIATRFENCTSLAGLQARPTNARKPHVPSVKDETGLPLTRQEVVVLTAVATGLSNKEIADQLYVCKRTVDYHISNAYKKLAVCNRVQAINACRAAGLLI